MEQQSLARCWQDRFGGLPRPQWVDRFAYPQDIDGCIVESEKNVSELKERLEQETFVLSWLHRLKKRQTTNAKDFVKPSPTAGSTNQREDSPAQSPFCLRRRAFDHVNPKDIQTAQRVSLKLKQSGKHLSSGNIEYLGRYSPGSSKHIPLSRERSMSDSVVQRPQVSPIDEGQIPDNARLSPIPDTPVKQVPDNNIKQSTQVNTSSDCIPPSNNMADVLQSESTNIKRLSNGTHETVSDDEEEDSETMSSMRTVIASTASTSPNQLFINTDDGNKRNSWLEYSGTLKRGMEFQNSVDGEKTPTGSLDTSVDALEKGLTLSMASDARCFSLDQGLDLREARGLYPSPDDDHKDSDLEEEEELEGNEDVKSQNEDTSSISELEGSGYHNYSNLAESTLTYILRDTIFASRSNSVSSLSGADTFSPELTPSHEVNLRSNGKRKDRNRVTQDRNRTAQVLREFGSNDDITDEAKLQKMLADLQDSSPSSPSSEMSSEPSSPSHLVPYVKPVRYWEREGVKMGMVN